MSTSNSAEPHLPFMQRCLDLALLAKHQVAPNPLVGAVVVGSNGKTLAEGYHQYFGGPHAEVNALNSVPSSVNLSEATLYVSLEPCCHHGKTPPCTDLIVARGIKKVVCACVDPFPRVHGGGIELLKQHGVAVTSGILQQEATLLNRRFFIFHLRKRPYIILKWAQSADGFIAPAKPGPYWISGEAARKLVHAWRSEEMAIFVGYRTALLDNPALTVRLVQGKNPLRIVFDRDLLLPRTHQIFNDLAPTIVINCLRHGSENGTTYLQVAREANPFPEIISRLYEQQVQSVIVEGGSATLTSLLEHDLWDEMRVFTADKILAAGLKAPAVRGVMLQSKQIESDKLAIHLNPASLAVLGVGAEKAERVMREVCCRPAS